MCEILVFILRLGAVRQSAADGSPSAKGRPTLTMRSLLALLALMAMAGSAQAETAQFDLAGPALRVNVTHQGATLPIAQVPQLATGDQISITADLPDDQSAHYLLIAAFLRGATNPPPDKWFFESELWTKKGRKGLSLTVPDGAEQIALFLAPATGGDFSTLRNAVQGRPGAFVRAAQELAQASLDRSRLDTYLAAIRKTVPGDPGRLDRITPLLARSLQVKINADCLTKLPDLQAPCLLQNQEALVLDDGHSNAITDAVAGPGADLALQLSATPQGGLGYYSPYIAAIRDVIGIFGSIRTAKYQYIPALAMLRDDRMSLALNTPPSFHNPKSVLVTALPVVAPIHVPPLQVVEATSSLCANATELLLPIGGAPLIYATQYAHDLVLRVRLPDGRTIDLPATPDAERGGLVIQNNGGLPVSLTAPVEATLHGVWGFQPFDGPKVQMVPAQPGHWRLGADVPAPGASISLTGGAAACVSGISVQVGSDPIQPVAWKSAGPNTISLTLPDKVARSEPTAITITGPSGVAPENLTLAAPAQPKGVGATVIARAIRRSAATSPVAISLAGDTDIPSDADLTFSLCTEKGKRFTGRETIEVAAESSGSTAILSGANGLRLADQQVAVASLTPATALGSSAFGPLRGRIVRDGVAGDWLSLGTLVRLPRLQQLSCPTDTTANCTLSGDSLFLISALSSTPGFEQPVTVPDGYPETTIAVPRPAGGKLYLRLRDDPSAIGSITG